MSGKHYSQEELLLLQKLADEGKVAREIGAILGRSEKAIRKASVRHGLKLGPEGGRHGDKCHFWKGGYTIDKNGYRLIKCVGHPFADSAGYVREHRLVMESVLGRYLIPLEVVHHKDGNKLNNDPRNLELFSRNSEHLKVELSGKCPKWTGEGKAALQRVADSLRKSEDEKKASCQEARIRNRLAVQKYRAKKRLSKSDAQEKQ